MYAVIRAGGKQYRVAPGDVIKIEKTVSANGKVEFSDVLAISGDQGGITRPESGARVLGSVVEEGRADKILVFHFKRKKQYKKMQGHRQPFTAVRITEIAFDGHKWTAPEVPARQAKAAKPAPAAKAAVEHAPSKKAAAAHRAAKKSGGAKSAGKRSGGRRADTKKKK